MALAGLGLGAGLGGLALAGLGLGAGLGGLVLAGLGLAGLGLGAGLGGLVLDEGDLATTALPLEVRAALPKRPRASCKDAPFLSRLATAASSELLNHLPSGIVSANRPRVIVVHTNAPAAMP